MNSSTFKKLGLFFAGGLAVLVIIIFLLGSAAGSIFSTPKTIETGRAFIEALATEDYETAYGLTHEEFKNVTAREDLVRLVEQSPELFNEDTTISLTGRGFDNGLHYVYGTIQSGEMQLPIYMEFLAEGDERPIIYFSFDEEDIPTFEDDEEGEEDGAMEVSEE